MVGLGHSCSRYPSEIPVEISHILESHSSVSKMAVTFLNHQSIGKPYTRKLGKPFLSTPFKDIFTTIFSSGLFAWSHKKHPNMVNFHVASTQGDQGTQCTPTFHLCQASVFESQRLKDDDQPFTGSKKS